MFKFIFTYLLIFFLWPCHLQAENLKPRQLSLHEAILLALRKNPSIQQAQLDHVLQKFSLEVAKWQFQPHYAFHATHTTQRNYSVTNSSQVTSNVSGIDARASWLSPVGTQLTVATVNNGSDAYHPGVSFQIIQPLLRGFGRPIVEAELHNAMDNEKISRLNVISVVGNTIKDVIDGYLDVMSAAHTLVVDQDALKRSNESIKQTKLFIKSGKKPEVELIMAEADAANFKTRIENDKNLLLQARYAILTTIGLDPNLDIQFADVDIEKLIRLYHNPTLKEAKQRILQNDIQYQIDQIILQGTTTRNIALAIDNTRWELDVTGNSIFGDGSASKNRGINSLANSINQTNSVMVNLTIPIDDKEAKYAVTAAKVALRQAHIALQQEKWNKQIDAINSWNSLQSAKRAVLLAINAKSLQTKTYQVNYKKYLFGLIDNLELQTAQQQLIYSEKAVIENKVSYLKFLVELDQLMGNTLNTWKIKVRDC